MKTEMLFFFYGSLCRGEKNFLKYSSSATMIIPAYTFGDLYLGEHGYPIMIIHNQAKSKVYGEVFKFNYDEKILKSLDELECFYEEEHPSNHYIRSQITAYDSSDNTTYQVWTYLCPPTKKNKIITQAQKIADGRWKSA